MNLSEASAFLGITTRTVRIAVQQGEIEAEHPVAAGPWIFNRCALQSDACLKLVERVHRRDRSPAVPRENQAILDFSTT